MATYSTQTLSWRHNEHDGLSNHQRLDCLLNHLCRCRSKKTCKLCFTGLQWLVDSPHKGPVMWKMFPFKNVIMKQLDGLVQERCNSIAKALEFSCINPERKWERERERERERVCVCVSLSAFLGTEYIRVHIVHISCVIITYTLE